jgi:low molecular weight protein-tyrosine phosphatase
MINKKVLFVCMGNICRSPAAEGIMTSLVKKNNLENSIQIDSAGTIAYHKGEGADPRMKKHAASRGYNLTSLARKFNPGKDFDEFDYIVTMDDDNYTNILVHDTDGLYIDKLHKMAKFSSDPDVTEIPDPYYGGAKGFETVIDILEDTCENLLEKIKDDIESENKK